MSLFGWGIVTACTILFVSVAILIVLAVAETRDRRHPAPAPDGFAFTADELAALDTAADRAAGTAGAQGRAAAWNLRRHLGTVPDAHAARVLLHAARMFRGGAHTAPPLANGPRVVEFFAGVLDAAAVELASAELAAVPETAQEEI